MASSKTEICNIALSHLGIAKEVANIDTESSAEASACRRFYEMARDETLRDFNWPFATKFAALALVEEDPTDEWSFSYRYPTDCLKVRRVLSGLRNDNRQSRVPYKVGRDDTGILLYCDIEDAEMEYTAVTSGVTFYPVDYVTALSYRIAYYIAPRLTAGDPFNLKNYCMEMYRATVVKAANSAINEEQQEESPESELIRSRY